MSTAKEDRPRVRAWAFAWLYFSEGAPIGFIWWGLPTLLRGQDVSVERITALTAALVLPWTLKFVVAPIVDVCRGPRWGLRHWVTGAQAGMGVFLLPLALWAEQVAPVVWMVLLLAHACCAALQDVAIDALAIASVPSSARGRVNAWMQFGMLGGRGLFGGGAILIASRYGWGAVMAGLVVAVWCSLAILWAFVPEPEIDSQGSRSALKGFAHTLGMALRKRSTWLGLCFGLVGGAGFEACGAIAGPMLVDLGTGEETIAGFFGIVVVAAMIAGAAMGGRWSDRHDRSQAVGIALVALSVLVGMVGGASWMGGGPVVVMVALAIVYLAIGVFTASCYAWFMDLTDARLGATQFSAFMAATNGCEAWAAWTGGRLVATAGYGTALIVLAALSLAGIPLLRASRVRLGGTRG